MGATRLQDARLAAGWSQLRAIAELESHARTMGEPIAGRASLKTMLSVWENGRKQPGELYRRLFSAIYERTDAQLGFNPPGPASPARRPVSVAPVAGPDLVNYFTNVFTAHCEADNLLGPHHLIGVVQAQTRLLADLLPSATGDIRRQLLRLACQYCEFCGWLHHDAGDLDAAMYWSDRAMDYALELGAANHRAYVLMRKSNVAIDQGSSHRALGLTEAAMTDSPQVSPRLRALIAIQQARAHAANGDASQCFRTIDYAHHQVIAAPDEHDPLAGYCSPAYVLMEAASCAAQLGMHQRALPVFTRSLEEWPGQQRRDQGLCLSRTAASSAAVADKDGALEYGIRAWEVVRTATSNRAMTALHAWKQRTTVWANEPEFDQLRNQIDNLLNPR